MGNICFIVGHGKSEKGGYDPGACYKQYEEFQIAKEITKYAQEYYNANYSDHADLMNYDGSIYLADRIKKVNAGDYDFIAEFHLNAGKGTGTECFYSKFSETGKGKQYAQAISKGISATFGVRNRGAKTKLNDSGKDYFGIIRQTKPTAVLIETLFIDTDSDVELIKSADGQKKCGETIAKAVAEVRGVSKKPTTTTIPTTTKPTTTTSGKGATVTNRYFKKYTGKSSSIVDGLVSVGADRSFAYRKKIANANGIKTYLGTPTQNLKLLNLLKQGRLIMP